MRGARQAVSALSFAPDGKILASSSDGDATILFWDARSGSRYASLTLPNAAAGEGVTSIVYAPDGKTLYTGGERGIEAWDVSPASPVLIRTSDPPQGKERETLRGHTDAVRSLAVLPGDTSLITRGEDGLIKLWDLALKRERFTFGSTASRVRCMGFNPASQMLAAGLRVKQSSNTSSSRAASERKAALQVQEKAQGKPKPSDPRVNIHAQAAADAEPAKSIPTTAIEVKVWKLSDGRERAALSGHDGAVVALDFSPDGKLLATCSRAGKVRLWETATFKPAGLPSGRQGGVDLVKFLADGKTLMGANAAGLITLWDITTGNARATLNHFGGMNMVVPSADGKILATGGGRMAARTNQSHDSGDVRLWDVATGRRLAVLPVPAGRVMRLCFSPDGKTLAAASEAPALVLWDVAALSPRATMTWPSGPALFLCFSPDGKTLAAGGEDHLLRLWDAASGKLSAILSGHSDAIDWVAFSAEGRTIYTASRDATIKLWDRPVGQPDRRNSRP
jgi:WD40 repeat protein